MSGSRHPDLWEASGQDGIRALIYLKPRTAVPTIDDLFVVLMGLPSTGKVGGPGS
jgi:hypothetical protein